MFDMPSKLLRKNIAWC